MDPTPYLAGLRLAGRRVLLAGGGSAVTRRVHRFLAAGADVVVVAPQVAPVIESLAGDGRLRWQQRPYADGDLDGAWYAMAATDDPQVNAAVGAEAERRRVFCVRADHGVEGSAVTPAVGRYDGLQVGVLAGGDHRRSGSVRDELLESLLLGRAGVLERPSGVAIVGGGPGDPDLITVRGARLLAVADVVVVDRLAPGELVERARADAEVVDASKIPYGRTVAQDSIHEILIDRARQGKFVVRLKGGDPYVFGRGHEELLVLAAEGIPTVIVPGVSAALAAPLLAGVPLTHRGVVHEAVVVSGHLPPGHPDSLTDWSALAALRGTIVVMMGLRTAREVAAVLLAGGRPADTPVTLVQDGSLPTQRRVDTTLSELGATVESAGLRSPVVIVIGPTAGAALRPAAPADPGLAE